MRGLLRRFVALVTTVGLILLLGVAAAAKQDVSVSVVGQEAAEDIPHLIAEFAAFTAETNIEVEYIQHEDPGGVEYLEADITLLDSPIFFNEPELVAEFLVDVGEYKNPRKLRSDFGNDLIDFVTVDGKILGVPVMISPKSLVWYQPSVFAAEGYSIPTTFPELVALSDVMVADGYYPWCNFIRSPGDSTGWVGTDWIEDLLLGAEGPAVYDQWIRHDVFFQDPRVETAFNRYVAMIDTPDYVYDREQMLSFFFWDNVAPLVNGDCLMHRQAAFFGNFMGPEQIEVLDTFKFPSVDPAYEDAVMGGARYASALTDSKEVRKFMRFLMSNEFGTHIVSGDDRTWILPNLRFDHSHYADPLQAEWAELTNTAQAEDLFRFDASDHMRIDQNIIWEGIRDLVNGADVSDVLDAIDAEWPGPWLEVISFEGHLLGHGFPPGHNLEYQVGSGGWISAGQANSEGEIEVLGAFGGPLPVAPGTLVELRSADNNAIIKQLTVVDLTYDSLVATWAAGIALGLAGDQLLLCYEADCITPVANGTTWSVNPLANGLTIDVGNIPSFINYFDAEGDAQQVADPNFLP